MSAKAILPFCILFGVMMGSTAFFELPQQQLYGAWYSNAGGVEQVLLFQAGYFSHTVFDKKGKKFLHTNGGPFSTGKSKLFYTKEFDTQNTDEIGIARQVTFSLNENTLILNENGKKVNFTRVDAGTSGLAGTWKITGRKQDGAITQIHQKGPCKTLKILSDSRFQWAAINPATKEFFGTGGGTYSFVDGKYTGHIEFFSRDSSRVGSSLVFNGKLVNGDWHHSGKSSRWDDIYEVWSRINMPH